MHALPIDISTRANMKKYILPILLLTYFILVPQVSASTSEDVAKVETFMTSIINTLVSLAGLTAVGFFAWGGFGYIISSGNPEYLERSKRTILYSAIGLVIVMGAYILANIVQDFSTSAFGTDQ